MFHAQIYSIFIDYFHCELGKHVEVHEITNALLVLPASLVLGPMNESFNRVYSKFLIIGFELATLTFHTVFKMLLN